MSKRNLDFYEIFSMKNFFTFILDNIIIYLKKRDYKKQLNLREFKKFFTCFLLQRYYVKKKNSVTH